MLSSPTSGTNTTQQQVDCPGPGGRALGSASHETHGSTRPHTLHCNGSSSSVLCIGVVWVNLSCGLCPASAIVSAEAWVVSKQHQSASKIQRAARSHKQRRPNFLCCLWL